MKSRRKKTPKKVVIIEFKKELTRWRKMNAIRMYIVQHNEIRDK